MKQFFSILVVMIIGVSGLLAQNEKIPGDLSSVLRRAKELRVLLATGRLVEALPFILPESRNEVLSGGKTTFRNPKVLGMDLTEDPSRVIVRISVEVPSLNAGTDLSPWVARDLWVWVDGQWYFDAGDFGRLWDDQAEAEDPEALRSAISAAFKTPSSIDIGLLLQDDVQVVSVPIEHSGDHAVRIEARIPSRLVGLEVSSTRFIKPGTTSFDLIINTEDFEGVLQYPLLLRVHYRGVAIDRTVTVEGTVLAPLVLELEVPKESTGNDEELRFVLQNNSDRVARINYMSGNGEIELIEHSDTIEAHAEGFVLLKRLQGVKPPDYLGVFLKEPLHGKRIYNLRLKIPPR